MLGNVKLWGSAIKLSKGALSAFSRVWPNREQLVSSSAKGCESEVVALSDSVAMVQA